MVKRKIFAFTDMNWSTGHVYFGLEKALPDYEFRYIHWRGWTMDVFKANFEWADICITSLFEERLMKSYLNAEQLQKWIFMSHGKSENDHAIKYDPALCYSMASDSLAPFFPSNVTAFVTPNAVNPADFIYRPRQPKLTNIGWCGGYNPVKQIEWTRQIAKETKLELKLATDLPFKQMPVWYQMIDLFIITSIPRADTETGPLPAFEAIVSGVPVIGTPVGNFRNIPGPKFSTVEEAVQIIESFKANPAALVELAKEQYDYVIKNYTYDVVKDKWITAFDYVIYKNKI
jgi:hypothetical protein